MADDESNEEELEAGEVADGPEDDDLDGDLDEPVADADDDDADVADEEDEEEDAADDTPRTKRKSRDDDDEDDEDLVDDDDVEADLDRILKDRMVTADDEEDEAADEPEERTEGGERLQPKQQNEQLCPSCFLLVKSSAPNCPVGDDDCPIFS